jgi:hypothetical protein
VHNLKSKAIGLLKLTFSVFILFALLNTVLDILLKYRPETNLSRDAFVDYFSANHPEPETIDLHLLRDFLDDMKAWQIAYKPAVGGVPSAFTGKVITIAADGHRLGQAAPQPGDEKVVVLGASQIWGYLLPDGQQPVDILNKKSKGLYFYNYAVPSQRILNSWLYWSTYGTVKQPDRIVHAGGVMDLLYACMSAPDLFKKVNLATNEFVGGGHDMAITQVIAKIKRQIIPQDNTAQFSDACGSDQALSAVVQRYIAEIKAVHDGASARGIPYVFMVLPSPFHSDMNIENIMNLPRYKALRPTLDKAVQMVRAALSRENLPYVIDLSSALPKDKAYFYDEMGHYTAEGVEVLSDIILGHLVPKGK